MSKERVANPRGPVWYLPHFVVTNKLKDNKRRLIFDAASKSNGVALNDHLAKGPRNCQPKSILNILLHFRESRFAVCADIREMFHRVRILDKDQDALRFLWRNAEPTGPMIFGSRSSPCSSQYVKNLNAARFAERYPRAVEAIVEYHYVDDFVDSFPTEFEASRVCGQVVEIHKAGGFDLRGFVSNSEGVLIEL